MATRAGSGQSSGITASAGALTATHATVSAHVHPATAAHVCAPESPPMTNEH
jgi:hypothetical protein